MNTSSHMILLDWQFWTALLALVAIVLSQLPPVRIWFRPRRIEMEVHSRIRVTHKVGNPNLTLYVSLHNSGGRALRVTEIEIAVERDGTQICELPAQSFFESPSAKSSVLLVPFNLKPGDSWSHATNFYTEFDRNTEKLFRGSESALGARIREKLKQRPQSDAEPVVAEPELIKPFLDLFHKMFVWQPGEYVVELLVKTKPGTASFSNKYRFTLFESDSNELISHTEDYKFGGGLSYEVDRHVGVSLPLNEHSN